MKRFITGTNSSRSCLQFECKNRRAIALDETKVKRQGKSMFGPRLMWTLKRFLVFISLRQDHGLDTSSFLKYVFAFLCQ